MPKIASWIIQNSSPVDPWEVQEMDRGSYCFSVRRGLVTLQIFNALLSNMVPLLARGLGIFRFDVRETENETTVRAIVDARPTVRLARRFRPFLDLYSAILRVTYRPTLKRFARMHMVKVSGMVEGDICLVFSKNGAMPLVVVKNEAGHRAIPLSLVLEEAGRWYSKFAIPEMTPQFSFDAMTPLLMQFYFRGSLDK
jgi:hypothetical protein